MDFYRQMQDAYGWTIREIHESDMGILLDQIRIQNQIEEAPEYGSIEDVLPL